MEDQDSTNTPYAQRAAERNQEYNGAFEDWLKSMSPEERKEAAALGITGAHIDSQGVGAPELDTSRIPDLSYMQDFHFDEADAGEGAAELSAVIERQVNRQVRRIVVELLESKNARLTVECLALVTGIGYLGISETSIAGKFNVTRAAVSKRCVELCDKLGLPPSRSMKSEAARESYRESRTASHEADATVGRAVSNQATSN